MAFYGWMTVIALASIVLFVVAYAGLVCDNDNRLIYIGGINYLRAANITAMHNVYRLQIAHGEVESQPRGTNLKRVYYDKQLAAHARTASLGCEMKHTNVSDPRWYHIGQNMYLEYTNVPSHQQNWEAALKSWFDEHLNYNYPITDSKKTVFSGISKATAHYTQLVWAESTNVGCEFVIFYEVQRVGTPYAKLYTCIYGPGGNVANKLPYLINTTHSCSELC